MPEAGQLPRVEDGCPAAPQVQEVITFDAQAARRQAVARREIERPIGIGEAVEGRLNVLLGRGLGGEDGEPQLRSVGRVADLVAHKLRVVHRLVGQTADQPEAGNNNADDDEGDKGQSEPTIAVVELEQPWTNDDGDQDEGGQDELTRGGAVSVAAS